MFKKNIPTFRQKHLPSTYGFLDEAGIFSDNNDELIAKRFSDKVFLKEVNKMANEALFKYQYCDINEEHNPGLNITLGGSLDILHPSMSCSNPPCRRKLAMNIARTAGLFANKIFVADHLSAYLANMDLKDPHCIDNIRMIVTSIKVFAPFINERIIKFRTPLNYCCANCNATIETEINNYLELNIDLDADMSINILEKSQKFKMISVDNYDLMSSYDMSLLFLQIPKREQSCLAKLSVGDKVTIKVKDNSYILEQIKNLLKNYLENVLLSTFSANRTSSLFISKSTMDTLFLSSIDKNKPQQSEIEVWEAMRSINLPWVGELDISQILTLRHQASASLESLRENLSLALMQGGEKKATEVVSEITSKVTELKQEIMANDIVKRSSKRYSAAFGSLAITLVVYGLASNVPVAAIGSVAALLATLSHMRTTEKEQEEKHAKIVTSPAYALLKAQDLLSCRE